MTPLDLLRDFVDALHRENRLAPLCLSTVRPDGSPSGRFVDLKAVSGGRLLFGTDSRSRKVREWTDHPRVALTAWWDLFPVQVRVVGTLESVPDSVSDDLFAQRSRAAQAIASVSTQSAVLSDRSRLRSAVAALLESASGPLPRPAFWKVFAVVPDEVEILRFSDDRIHERTLFAFAAGEWTTTALSP